MVESLGMVENNEFGLLKSARKVGGIAEKGMATLRITGHIRPRRRRRRRRRRVTTYIRTCGVRRRGAGGPFSVGAISLFNEN